jgi:xanthine/CO dehydrogenase XdhC/CoxF family maturation factor
LVICGGGDDAIPLAQLAARMGWAVVVADPRPTYATTRRFPEARKCLVAPPDQIAREIPVGDRTAVVIMTHHYHFDVPLLHGLVTKPLGYLGLLGPMKRAERILAEIEADGVAVTPEMRARLRAPVGLDLGSEAPEGIALSIVAEIHAVLSGRDGRPLKERALPIHA